MKLIVITKTNPFFISSASANRMRSLLEGLKEQKDIEIELWITEGYQNKSELKQLGQKGEYEGFKYNYLSTYILATVWKKRYYKYVGSIINNLFLHRKLKNRIKSNQIIWVPKDLKVWMSLLKLKKEKHNIRLFFELSEFLDIHHHNKGNFFQRLNADKEQDFFEKKFMFQLDGFALMTKTLYNYFNSFQGKLPKMIHLPMTVDLDRFNNKSEKLEEFEKPYIAFVGVMNNVKDGVDILIKSFANISSIFPNYKLYLIGPWNYDTPEHLKLIRDYNLEERIKWKGSYDREKIPNIIQNADLLVLPRPDSKQARGGFPTKLGEYLATGVPVCATKVGELPDYLVNNKSVFFAAPGSIQSFADTMKRALDNKKQANKIGVGGKSVAKKEFNKDIQSEKLFHFIKEIYENQK